MQFFEAISRESESLVDTRFRSKCGRKGEQSPLPVALLGRTPLGDRTIGIVNDRLSRSRSDLTLKVIGFINSRISKTNGSVNNFSRLINFSP